MKKTKSNFNKNFVFVCLSTIFLVGCGNISFLKKPTPTPEPTVEPTHNPDPNSCVGYCNQKAPGGCWCDSLCKQYNDCCSDKVQACG